LTIANTVTALTIGKEATSADGNSDANVTIGAATSIAGPISVYGGNIAINAATTATGSDINLYASGAVSQTAALTANRLALNGTGSFTLQNSANNVGIIAGGDNTTRLGNLAYRDADALEIGSVNPDGIFSSGTVLIETENSDLTLSQNINTTSTSDDAIIVNAGRTAAAGTATGGNVLVSGSPTLSYGSGGRAKLFSGSEGNSTNLTNLVGGAANTRAGFDEGSDLSGQGLVDDNAYAIYRLAEGTGDLTIVASGGDAENSTWKFNSGSRTLTTIGTPVDVNASVVEGYLASGDLTIEAGNIEVQADISSSGSNTFTLKALGKIEIHDNSDIETNGGDLIVWANSDNLNGGNVLTGQNVTFDSRQGGASTGGGRIHMGGGADTNSDGFPDDATAGTGNFTGGAAYGILFGNAAGSGVQLLSGGGDITLIGGIDGNFNAAANAHGIGFFPGYTVNANAGDITFNGYANSGGAATIGIDLMTLGATNASSITTTGDLTFNGESTVTTNTNHGIILNNGLTINAGTVNITGNSEETGVILNGSITSDISMTLRANSYSFSSGSVSGQGTLTIEPLTISNSFNSTFNSNGLTLGSDLTGLTIGKSTNTADVTISNIIDIAGTIEVYGGDIAVNESLTATASGADILLKGSGEITMAGSKNIQANDGDIILWADSDNNSDGAIAVLNGSSINSQGGDITLAGGADDGSNGGILGDGKPDGYAWRTSDEDVLGGLSLGQGILAGHGEVNDPRIDILSAGGDIKLFGRFSGPGNYPGVLTQENILVDAGTGTISINGHSSNGHGIEFARGATTHQNVFRSQSNDATKPAISIVGTTTSDARIAVLLEKGGSSLIQSEGTGEVYIRGTATVRQALIAKDLQILAASGDISFEGSTTSTNGIELINADIGQRSSTTAIQGITPLAASSSNVAFKSTGFTFSGSESLISSTGSLTIEPLSGASFGTAFTYADFLTIDNNLTGLTIGKDGNTTDISLSRAIDIAGPISVYGGDISIDAATTATDSDINLFASGTVSQSAALTANRLALNGTGSFTLENTTNNIATLAAGSDATKIGSLSYVDADALEIGSVNPTGIT